MGRASEVCGQNRQPHLTLRHCNVILTTGGHEAAAHKDAGRPNSGSSRIFKKRLRGRGRASTCQRKACWFACRVVCFQHNLQPAPTAPNGPRRSRPAARRSAPTWHRVCAPPGSSPDCHVQVVHLYSRHAARALFRGTMIIGARARWGVVRQVAGKPQKPPKRRVPLVSSCSGKVDPCKTRNVRRTLLPNASRKVQ
jgi:hypothetical protein